MNIILEHQKDLFRDEASYQKFVQYFKKQTSEGGMSAVLIGDEVIGTMLSPQATKDVLYERFIHRIAEKPEILEKLADRIKNDPIVD